MASIVESSDDAIIGKTLEGIITSWNRGAERLYGYSAEEALGQHITLIVPRDQPNEIPMIMERLRQGERIDHYETIRQTKSGRILNISLTISPIRDEDDKLVGASAIGRDVTEVRRAEAAVRLAERLAAVGRHAATIAHEINNPLESIANVLYLLSRENIPENTRDLITLAQEELRRVSEIVRQTLSFNRASTLPSEFTVKDAMNDVLDMYGPRIRDKHIEVDRRYLFDGKILGYAVEIRQVFANLVRNAIEAMPNSGKLTVLVRRASAWKDGKTSGVRVLVVDSGTGIPERLRDQMFNPFFSTKQEHGNGLGLWVSKQIVVRHGGSIRFRTRTGRGTAFSLFVPLRPPAQRLTRTDDSGSQAPISMSLSKPA